MTSETIAPAMGALILERLPQVLRRTGVSRSAWYRQIANGTAPRPVPLGDRARAWNAAEVDSWIVARIAARDAKAAQ